MLSRPGKLTWYIIIINPRNSGRLQWALLVERKSQEEAEGKLCFDNMSIFVLNVFVNDILILDGPDPVLYSWISFSDKCLKEWAGVLYIYMFFLHVYHEMISEFHNNANKWWIYSFSLVWAKSWNCWKKDPRVIFQIRKSETRIGGKFA